MIALAIFAGTYLVLAIGGLPGFRIDRTGAAIIGASLMVGFNVALAGTGDCVPSRTDLRSKGHRTPARGRSGLSQTAPTRFEVLLQ